MFNRATVVGFISTEPKVFYYDNGSKQRVTFGLTNYITRDVRCFIDCVAFNNIAEVIKQYHQGDLVIVDGTLQSSSFNDINGVRRKRLEINVNLISYFSTPKTPKKDEDEIDDPLFR